MLKLLVAVLLISIAGTVSAESPASGPAANLPAIALIIDDLGNHSVAGELVVRLPGPVACSFLPHAPFTDSLARQAHRLNKEVLLHLPMQADGHSHALREKGVLTHNMTQSEFISTLQDNLGAIPHVSGLNNHMGSMLTRYRDRMKWLMQSINKRGSLFFVDSRTTGKTVAHSMAREFGIPSSKRNVFLDNELEPASIRARFQELLNIARRQGTALGIGHPHAVTLGILREEIARLNTRGVELIPVARLIELQGSRNSTWQAYLSR